MPTHKEYAPSLGVRFSLMDHKRLVRLAKLAGLTPGLLLKSWALPLIRSPDTEATLRNPKPEGTNGRRSARS